MQYFGKRDMFLSGHLETICLGIAASVVKVGRVAVEKGRLTVIEPYYVNRRSIFNLDPKEPHGNFGEGFYPSHPTGNHT